MSSEKKSVKKRGGVKKLTTPKQKKRGRVNPVAIAKQKADKTLNVGVKLAVLKEIGTKPIERITEVGPGRKIAVICAPGLDAHLGEVTDLFKSKYELKLCVTNNLEHIFNAIKWADTVWIEWANQTAVYVTSFGHLMHQKQIILRLHSYEAFIPELAYIHWENITDLIFVAEHIKKMVLRQYPVISKAIAHIHVIPNGIDLQRFDIPQGKKYLPRAAKSIAYLGYLNPKKGIQLMLAAFAELVKNDPEFVLHIGGAFQEPRYVGYIAQLQQQNKELLPRLKFHSWIDKQEKWLSDKGHIICASVLESQCKSIMEGMAMGLKPLVHNFVGARDIYPPGVIWNTVTDFCSLALDPSYNALSYRAFVRDNYNTVDTVKKIDAVINAKPSVVDVISSTTDKSIRLSAVMLMRDEEKNLPRCLDSIKGICDEIIIVDTGSEDNSIRIAKKYGAKIYKHPWEDDFSLHRNQSIGYATGDWVFVIDCDEELTGDVQGIKKVLSKLNDGYNSVSVNQQGGHGALGNQVNTTRLFRRGHIRYERAWHNKSVVDGVETYGTILYNDAVLVHHGAVCDLTEADEKRKTARSKVLMEKALAQDPEDYEIYFFMMHAYGIEEKWQAAVNCAEKYIAQRHCLHGFQLSGYYSNIRL